MHRNTGSMVYKVIGYQWRHNLGKISYLHIAIIIKLMCEEGVNQFKLLDPFLTGVEITAKDVMNHSNYGILFGLPDDFEEEADTVTVTTSEPAVRRGRPSKNANIPDSVTIENVNTNGMLL